MSKKKALCLMLCLAMCVVMINMYVAPALGFFMNVGTPSTMFAVGQQVGKALGKAFGNSLFEFIAIVLFLA